MIVSVLNSVAVMMDSLLSIKVVWMILPRKLRGRTVLSMLVMVVTYVLECVMYSVAGGCGLITTGARAAVLNKGF